MARLPVPPQQLLPHAAQLIYHASIADIVRSLGDIGFDTKEVLDFADFVCEVDHGGEKDFLRMNGLTMLMEGAFVFMNGFLKTLIMFPSFGMVRRWSPARP